MRTPVRQSPRSASRFMVGAVSTPRVLLALALLAGCASAGAPGQDPRGSASEMAPVPVPPREPEAPSGQRGWAFEVRDDPGAEPVWVGTWTTESCERLQAGFVARSQLPSRRVSGCRPLIFTTEARGRQVWAVSSDAGFVASPAEATCAQTVARMTRDPKSPSCAPVWVTFP
jgi:hypothetical protein